MPSFGERVKSLRKERKMKQVDLAKILGVTERTIRNYESDEREPDLSGLNALADFFDVPLDYLTGKTEDPKGTVEDNDDDEFEGLDEMEREMLEELRKNPDTMLMFYNYKDLPPEERKSVLQLILELKRKKK